MDAFGSCRTGLGCLRTARAARIDMTEILSLARRTNAAIDAASLMPSCRRALRAKKHELRLATRARDAHALPARRHDGLAHAVSPPGSRSGRRRAAIGGAALGCARAQDLPQRVRTVARAHGTGRARMTG